MWHRMGFLGIFSSVPPFLHIKSMSLAPCQLGASAVKGNANDCRMFTRALAVQHWLILRPS